MTLKTYNIMIELSNYNIKFTDKETTKEQYLKFKEFIKRGGMGHQYYVAYYIFKHRLKGEERDAYLEDEVRNHCYKGLYNGRIAPYCGGHVVAQWLMEHPNNDWNNNYLIYLRANIDKWRNRLDMLDIDYSEFKEPDLDGRITAIAVHHQGNLFKNLKTIKN